MILEPDLSAQQIVINIKTHVVEIDFFERAAGDRGKITNLPQTSGNDYFGLRSPSHCERSKNSFCSKAASSSKTSYFNDFRVGKNSRDGSAKSPTKGGNFSDNTVGRWVLQPPFSNPEERRYNATSFRLKFIKQLYRKQTFSDGKFVIDQNATQSGRLDDQIRFARRLPYSGNRSPVSKISPFYLERQKFISSKLSPSG